MLEKLFKLSENGTTARTEVVAGVTTFLTMSYIIFVNPDILSSTGMDRSAIFVATCVAAALGSAVMGLFANWPIGMAPGMGLNAFFAFTVVAAMGFSWQQALGAVFISGMIFLLLTVTGARAWLIRGIPRSLRSAIAVGIGLFLAIIALKNAGIGPSDVQYVNAHGTSTPMNDRAETAAVRGAFGEHAEKLAMSSTKSMTGHLLGASGAVEAILTAYALADGFLPPTVGYRVPDAQCGLDIVPNVGRACEIAYALSSSLGFGGHNAALVLRKV